MKIGDLVRFNDSPDIAIDPKDRSTELGIITITDPAIPLRCHVEWFTE